ncbi:MAG: hypothetical protein ABIN01_11035 [Ferruginibacter sp.]
MKSLETKTAQLLRSHTKELQYQHEVAKRKLAATQKRYEQKMRLLDLVDHLKAKNKSASVDGNQTAWLNMIELQALKTVRDNGPHVQAMLQLKIGGIKHEYKQATILNIQG